MAKRNNVVCLTAYRRQQQRLSALYDNPLTWFLAANFLAWGVVLRVGYVAWWK
jgi:hypothetical protein